MKILLIMFSLSLGMVQAGTLDDFAKQDFLFLARSDKDISVRAMAISLLKRNSSLSPEQEKKLAPVIQHPDIQYLLDLWEFYQFWKKEETVSISRIRKKIENNNNVIVRVSDTRLEIDDRITGKNIVLTASHEIWPARALETPDKKTILNRVLFYIDQWHRLYLSLISKDNPKEKLAAVSLLLKTYRDPIMQDKLVEVMSDPEVYKEWLLSEYYFHPPRYNTTNAEDLFKHFMENPSLLMAGK